jgi:hypothetical protein
MTADPEHGGSRGKPGFAFWVPTVTALVSAAWTLYVHVAANARDDMIRKQTIEREERLKAGQAEIEQRVRQLQMHEHQLDVIPRAIDLMKESSCASDFLALTLLRETRSVIGLREPAEARGDMGLAATKAVFRLLSVHQDVPSKSGPYCTCAMLESIRADFVDRGEGDAETTRLAAAVLDQGAKDACHQQPTLEESIKKAADLAGKGFSIVFVNASDCAILKSVYRRAKEALTAVGEDPAGLKMASGHNAGATFQVVAFGEGNLSLERASDLVSRLRGQPGVRDDIYWAHKLDFGRAACSPD